MNSTINSSGKSPGIPSSKPNTWESKPAFSKKNCDFNPVNQSPIARIEDLPADFDMRDAPPPMTASRLEYIKTRKLQNIQQSNQNIVEKVAGMIGWNRVKLWYEMRDDQKQYDLSYRHAEEYLPETTKEKLSQYQWNLLNGHNYYIDKFAGLLCDGLSSALVVPQKILKPAASLIPQPVKDTLNQYIVEPCSSFLEQGSSLADRKWIETQGPIPIKTYQAQYQQAAAGWLSDLKKSLSKPAIPSNKEEVAEHIQDFYKSFMHGQMVNLIAEAKTQSGHACSIEEIKQKQSMRVLEQESRIGQKIKEIRNAADNKEALKKVDECLDVIIGSVLDLMGYSYIKELNNDLQKKIQNKVENNFKYFRSLAHWFYKFCLNPVINPGMVVPAITWGRPAAKKAYSLYKNGGDFSWEQVNPAGILGGVLMKWTALPAFLSSLRSIVIMLTIRKAETYKSLLDQVSPVPDSQFSEQQIELIEKAKKSEKYKDKDFKIERWKLLGSGSINQAYTVELSEGGDEKKKKEAIAKFVRPDARSDRLNLKEYCRYLFYTNLIRLSQNKEKEALSDDDKIRAYNEMLEQIKTMEEESQLSMEAENLDRLKSALGKAGIKDLNVPELLASTKTGLLIQKMPGKTLLRCSDQDRKKAYEKAGPGIIAMCLESDVCHGDLHEGNLLYDKQENKISLIDTGTQFHYDPEVRQALLGLMALFTLKLPTPDSYESVTEDTRDKLKGHLCVLTRGESRTMTEKGQWDLIKDILFTNYLSDDKQKKPWVHEIYFNYMARNRAVPEEGRLRPLSMDPSSEKSDSEKAEVKEERLTQRTIQQASAKARGCLENYLKDWTKHDEIASQMFRIIKPETSKNTEVDPKKNYIMEHLKCISGQHFL